MVQMGTRVGFYFILLWLFTSFEEINAVKIEKIVAPDVIQYGTRDSVVLDCDYSLGNYTEGLVVKWFFGDDKRLVYQWIPSQKQAPQVLGLLRGRVDLTYNVSDDPLKVHRALRIVNIDTDISGSYTCVVSTFMDEYEKTKEITVFVPEKFLHLTLNKSDDTVTVICNVDGVYPEPQITIAIPERILDATHDVKLLDGRYSDTATVTLHNADLPSHTKFICTMKVPNVMYTVREEAIYNPGSMSGTRDLPKAVFVLLHKSAASTGKNLYMYLVLLAAFTQIITQ